MSDEQQTTETTSEETAAPAEGAEATTTEGGEAAAPAVEAKTEPAPEPKKEREARIIADAARRERATRAKEAAIAAEKAQIAKDRAELDAIKGKLGKFKEDPDGVMRSVFGLTFEEAVRQHLLANTPEAKQAAVGSELQQLRDELASMREERAKERQQMEEARRQHEHRQGVQRVQQEFLSIVTKDAAQYPNLVGYDDAVIIQAAIDKGRKLYALNGTAPTEEQVLKELEAEASAIHASIEQRRQQRLGVVPQSDDSSERAKQGSGPRATRPVARAVSNSTAATKAAPSRQMSEDEEDRWALEQLRAARRT